MSRFDAWANQLLRQLLQHFDESEFVMAEKDYANPVWSYPDSLGPAIYYGHTPEFNGCLPPMGRQTSGAGNRTNPPHWTVV
jgi:hypothetical protein